MGVIKGGWRGGGEGGGRRAENHIATEDMMGKGSKHFRIQKLIHVTSKIIQYSMYHTASSFSLIRTRSFEEVV